MTFRQRLDVVASAIGAPGLAISVYADRRTPDAAYVGVDPITGTIAIDTGRNVTIFERGGDRVVKAWVRVGVRPSELQGFNGATVTAWIVDGDIRTIGTVGALAKPRVARAEAFERFLARHPLLVKWYGRRFAC